MEKSKILFAQQEIYPYIKESSMSLIGRHLPQGIQERGKEIRTFMPRYGCINERRNQLHEVIRLSGMNLIINENDHPLIIKVASIPSARMQVYFIDNDDYFSRKAMLTDKSQKYYKDNDERSIFYCRGVLETVKKLAWPPDVVHCHGWISALLPIYIKKAFKDNPVFSDSKVIYSIYDDDFSGSFSKNYADKIKLPGISTEDLNLFKDPTFVNITKAAIHFSDAVIISSPKINPELEAYIKTIDKPILEYQNPDNYIDAYSEFYDEIFINNSVLS
ncbi:MAG: glycogen/starch synthase [Bacteroidales bacterium]|nr:glycogen/starch synthase [Bacteroidales bacterium]